MAESANVAAWAFQGVELCRQGQWERGLDLLARAAESDDRSTEGPSLMYSYLGYGIARYKGRPRDGVALCEHAVKLEFFQPDNQFNLARTYMLVGNREKAVAALRRGLKLDPDHGGLRTLALQMGQRRPPVLRFLSRDHPLNKMLGRLRHSISTPNDQIEGETSRPKPAAAKAAPAPPAKGAPAAAAKAAPAPPAKAASGAAAKASLPLRRRGPRRSRRPSHPAGRPREDVESGSRRVPMSQCRIAIAGVVVAALAGSGFALAPRSSRRRSRRRRPSPPTSST